MAAPRRFNQKKSPIQPPTTIDQWHALMRQAIERAEMTGDRRIHGLRKALVDNKVERALRQMGIIHPVDILREFPTKA